MRKAGVADACFRTAFPYRSRGAWKSSISLYKSVKEKPRKDLADPAVKPCRIRKFPVSALFILRRR